MPTEYPESLRLIHCIDLQALHETISQGALEPNARGAYGETALHVMAYEPGFDPSLAQLFIDNGADAQIRDKLGNTPLDLARAHGNHRIADVLERALNSTSQRARHR